MKPKKFQKILIIILALTFLGSSLGGYFIWTKLKEVSRAAYEKGVYLDNFTNKVFALQNLKRSYAEIKSDLENINFALPKEKKADRLMTDLESLALKNQTRLTIFKYADSSGKTKKKVENASDLVLSQTEKKENYLELPLEITVEGTYPNVLAFVKDMESSKRFISMVGIDITRINQPEGMPQNYIKLVSNIKVYIKQ